MVSVKPKIIFPIIIFLFLLVPVHMEAVQEDNSDTQPLEPKQEKKLQVPSIADLTPLIAEMSSRKAVLEKEMPDKAVLFRKFGDSSLDFELRVWTSDVDNRLTLISDLHREIDREFREAGIVIAFPQRDIHLDSTKPVEVRVLTQEKK